MKPVTTQEKKILHLIANGMSARDMADALSISRHTVESHRKTLLLKLNAQNSAELVHKAMQAGLLNKSNENEPDMLNPSE